jgi:RNA polymerase sigma-70 factor (ECF subfamily)
MAKIDEQDILKRIQEPRTRRQAFEQIVNVYSRQLYWQIHYLVQNHEDTDDVLQNTFIKAWNNIENFHGDSKLLTWLSRIAINESLDFMRKKKNHMIVSMDDEGGVASMLMSDNYFDGDETEAQLQEAIAQLPDVQRTVFNLRYYDEMKYSEISQILGTTEGGLKASYHFAVKKITDFFHRHD